MPPIKLKLITLTEEVCLKNNDFWKSRLTMIPSKQDFNKNLTLSNSILPSHTFAFRYYDSDSHSYFYPLKSIFKYDETTEKFDATSAGLIASSKRRISEIPDNHMSTSYKLGHDVFLFAYHGVHNPYHRYEDPHPIRPFGLFFKREIETFPFCHGSPCDIAEKNPIVDRAILDKYYLLPNHLREYKAAQITYDESYNSDFWFYFGNPIEWERTSNYGKNLFTRAGEFRYYENIKPSNIEGILWPFDTDRMMPGNIPDIDANLDLYSSFKNAFPDISIISYTFEEEHYDNWALALVEASFYSTKYRIKFGKYPQNAESAKKELMEEKNEL